MRVFISSVMQGFKAERQGAKEAVEALQMQPIMAENFPALPVSSQKACLDGVRQSDAYVGILGSRYGFVTASGISATEEEFNEARRLGRDILWFIQETNDREESAAEFLARISSFEEGWFRKSFANVADLKTSLMGALHALSKRKATASLDAAGALAPVKELLAHHHRNGQGCGVFFIALPTHSVDVDLFDLEQRQSETVAQWALFGETAFIPAGSGAVLVAEPNCLAVVPGHQYHRLGHWLRLHEDGSFIAYGTLERASCDHTDIVSIFVVDRDDLAKLLRAQLAYAHGYYSKILGNKTTDLYLTAAIQGGREKLLGRIAAGVRSSSMSLPMCGSIDDPVIVTPLTMTVPQLAGGEGVAEKITKAFERLFRAAGQYYVPARA